MRGIALERIFDFALLQHLCRGLYCEPVLQSAANLLMKMIAAGNTVIFHPLLSIFNLQVPGIYNREFLLYTIK